MLHADLPRMWTAPLKPSSRAYRVVPPPRDSEEKRALDRILRVDHAGEYGANRIYAGQMAVLGRTRTGPLIQVCASVRIRFVKCITSTWQQPALVAPKKGLSKPTWPYVKK